MIITDLAKAVAPEAEQKVVGIRPGEKVHEQMIGVEDAASTFEYDDYYKILPVINDWSDDLNRIKDGVKVDSDFSYDSSTNTSWMSVDELQAWVEKNTHKMGKL